MLASMRSGLPLIYPFSFSEYRNKYIFLSHAIHPAVSLWLWSTSKKINLSDFSSSRSGYQY